MELKEVTTRLRFRTGNCWNTLRVIDMEVCETVSLGRVIHEELSVTIKWSKQAVACAVAVTRQLRSFVITALNGSSLRFVGYIESIGAPYSWEGQIVADVNFGPIGEKIFRKPGKRKCLTASS